MTQHESSYSPTPSSSITPASPTSNKAAIKEQAATIGEDVRELGRIAREAAREEIATLRGRGEDAALNARIRMNDMERSLEQSVRENPMRSIAYAAGIGVALGLFLRR